MQGRLRRVLAPRVKQCLAQAASAQRVHQAAQRQVRKGKQEIQAHKALVGLGVRGTPASTWAAARAVQAAVGPVGPRRLGEPQLDLAAEAAAAEQAGPLRLG